MVNVNTGVVVELFEECYLPTVRILWPYGEHVPVSDEFDDYT